MGWKGTLRSAGAAVRRAERQARRRQKELERRQREIERMAELEQAAYEVEVFENYLERIVSLHQEEAKPVGWELMTREEAPPSPAASDARERWAAEQLASYRPGLWDRLLGREEAKRQALAKQLERAKAEDRAAYEAALEEHRRAVAEIEERRELAARVLAGEPEAQHEALRELGNFSEISDLGSRLSSHWDDDGGPLQIELEVHGEEIVPKERKSRLKSGKLSVKALPKGTFYGLYQDYVCSCVFRLARETFALLPVSAVIITALDDLLDTATGHLETSPILSVAIPRTTFETLNLDQIDPSDALTNFVHEMDFKKTKGFSPVSAVDPGDLPELAR